MIFRNVVQEKDKLKLNTISLGDKKALEWLGIDTSSVDVTDEKALKEATVFACIKILSETVAKLPIKIYEGTSGVKKATDHYLYNILKLRPNKLMSSYNFFTATEAQRNVYGNAYVNIEFDKFGKIKGLWPIESKMVEIWVDDVGLFTESTEMWYIVTLKNNKRIKLKSNEVLHFKGFTLDGLVGITPITYLRHLIENGKSSQDYINQFYKNGMQSKGIIHYVGEMNNEAKKTFKNQFEDMSSGLNNAHRVSLLPIGYQFQPLSLTMADAQFLENSELTIKQIASVFGIKLHQLNELERSTHNNLGEQQKQFYVDTLMAILTMYEQEIDYKLFLNSELEKGYYSKFNVDAITRSDIKSRYEAYRVGIQGGFLTPNEVRSKEEYESLEGGDTLLVNGNMVPITKVGAAYTK